MEHGAVDKFGRLVHRNESDKIMNDLKAENRLLKVNQTIPPLFLIIVKLLKTSNPN